MSWRLLSTYLALHGHVKEKPVGTAYFADLDIVTSRFQNTKTDIGSKGRIGNNVRIGKIVKNWKSLTFQISKTQFKYPKKHWRQMDAPNTHMELSTSFKFIQNLVNFLHSTRDGIWLVTIQCHPAFHQSNCLKWIQMYPPCITAIYLNIYNTNLTVKYSMSNDFLL